MTKLITLTIFTIIFVSSVVPVFGAIERDPRPPTEQGAFLDIGCKGELDLDNLAFKDLKCVIQRNINIFAILIPTFLITGLFSYAGILYITSRGDPGQIKKAKDTMTWAVIGFIVMFSAATIVAIIFNAFDLSLEEYWVG